MGQPPHLPRAFVDNDFFILFNDTEDESHTETNLSETDLSTLRIALDLIKELEPKEQLSIQDVLSIHQFCEEKKESRWREISILEKITSICESIFASRSHLLLSQIVSERLTLKQFLEKNPGLGSKQLLKLAPRLQEVNIVGLEDYFLKEGMSTETFLKACSTMTSLTCSGNTLLTSIYSDTLTRLVCDGCTSLKSIEAPNLLILYYSNCTKLAEIHAKKLMVFLGSNCWSLKRFEVSPSLIKKFEELEIQRNRLEHEPEASLSDILPYWIVNNAWPRVVFTESNGTQAPAIDASGLGKVAQATLFQSLFTKTSTSILLKEDDFLPYNPSELSLPIWHAVGIGMAIAFRDGYTLGSLFGLSLYKCLRLIPWPVDSLEPAQKEHLLQQLFPGIGSVSEPLEYMPEFLDPILEIARGMQNILEDGQWSVLRSFSAEKIQAHIEGVISADALISRLCKSENLDAVQMDFLLSWIIDRKEEPVQLVRLLKAVTGSPGISPLMPSIKVLPGVEGHLPRSQTCFNQLILAPDVKTKEKFNANLELFLQHTEIGSGFSMS
jgi:hypothetical protein